MMERFTRKAYNRGRQKETHNLISLGKVVGRELKYKFDYSIISRFPLFVYTPKKGREENVSSNV